MPESISQFATTFGLDPLTCILSDQYDHDLDPLGNSCCICYCAYSSGATDYGAEDPVRLECGHVFGEKCLSKWTSTNSTCPLCRRRAKPAFQNDMRQALGEKSSYGEELSWFDEVCFETDTDAESEADCGVDILGEEMWFNIIGEAIESCQSSTSLKGPVVPIDDCFDDLTYHHELWMAESLFGGDCGDEDTVDYYNIFPY